MQVLWRKLWEETRVAMYEHRTLETVKEKKKVQRCLLLQNGVMGSEMDYFGGNFVSQVHVRRTDHHMQAFPVKKKVSSEDV